MTSDELRRLILSLISLPKETEWFEFKRDKTIPQEIGEYVSALANSAALLGEPNAYIIWGVEDQSHEIVGTSFKPKQKKVGNEELENWLLHQLEPQINIQIHEGEVGGKRVVVFQIPPATHMPIRFGGTEFIRIGSYKKKLMSHPEKEQALWALFSQKPFENGVAAASASGSDVLSLIDYPRISG